MATARFVTGLLFGLCGLVAMTQSADRDLTDFDLFQQLLSLADAGADAARVETMAALHPHFVADFVDVLMQTEDESREPRLDYDRYLSPLLRNLDIDDIYDSCDERANAELGDEQDEEDIFSR